MAHRNCLICKVIFQVKPSQIARGGGKYCSHYCRNVAGGIAKHKKHSQAGNKNPSWKGGITKSPEYQRERTAAYRNKNPQKYKSQKTLQNAVARGKVKKLKCQVCGDTNSQGHHPDYSKPLDVIWLCQTHHKAIHAGKIKL